MFQTEDLKQSETQHKKLEKSTKAFFCARIRFPSTVGAFFLCRLLSKLNDDTFQFDSRTWNVQSLCGIHFCFYA